MNKSNHLYSFKFHFSESVTDRGAWWQGFKTLKGYKLAQAPRSGRYKLFQKILSPLYIVYIGMFLHIAAWRTHPHKDSIQSRTDMFTCALGAFCAESDSL